MKNALRLSVPVLFSILAFGASAPLAFAYAPTDFAAFDGVNIGTNSYTVSTGITATYVNGTGTSTSSPVLLKLTGYAPIVTPWFNQNWTAYNYVTIGIKLPVDFTGISITGGTAVSSTGVSFNDGISYDMGSGSTPLATTSAALGYLDFSFGANKSYVTNGLVKLEVIWNATSTPEYFTIDVSGLQTGPVFIDKSKNGTFDSGELSFNTIQAAIDAASSGDTINVAAGNYTEQLVINKNLTITGAGRDTTTIQAPAELTNDPDGAKTIVLFTGSAVTTAEISGFTIQGPVNGLNFGIYVRDGATANIHDNTVKDIRDEPLSGAQHGYGIEVGKYNDTSHITSTTGHATITNNTVIGYQKTGIEVEGAGSSGTITGNIVTGAGLIPTTSQNGIQIRRGATGTIGGPLPSDANTVTGNAYTGHEVNATGISVTFPGNDVIVQGNIVNHNTANIYTYEANGVQILNNQVSDSADGRVVAGITADSDNVASSTAGITDVTISGNTVRNNLSGGSHQGPGIFLWGIKSGIVSGNEIAGSGDDGLLIGSSGNIAITNNLFSGNGFNSFLSVDPNAAAIDFGGVVPELESYGFWPNLLGGFAVHNNSFTGNKNAVWNYDTASIDASNNWWGTASSTEIAAKVSSHVDYTPWYINPGRTILSTAISSGGGGSGTITVTTPTIDFAETSDGAVDLGVSNLALGNDSVLNFATSTNPITTEDGVNGIVIAGGFEPLSSFKTGDMVEQVNLTQPLNVGGEDVLVGQAIQLSSGTPGTPTVLTNSSLSNVSVSIPDDTTILAPSGWDKTIQPPKTGSNDGTAPSGFSVGDTVISVGSPDVVLLFDKAVKITLTGVTGTVGYKPASPNNDSDWKTINTQCTSATDHSNIAFPGECYFPDGGNTIIWTYHFTSFGEFIPDSTPTPAPVSHGGGGNVCGIGFVFNSTTLGCDRRATPATPAVPGVSPAVPATPSINSNGNANGRVLGAATFNFTRDLGIGFGGADVTELQKVLIDAGILKINAPTGNFGQLTKAAVQAFQKSHGVSQTGFVGPLTRGELNKGVTPTATNLTSVQADAILSLLESFGADASVVAKVRASLGR